MNRLPWIMAAMWLAARFVAGKFLTLENARNFGVLSNVLLILILIFLTVYFKYKVPREERPTFISDMKDCMRSALKYVFGVVLSIAVYYSFLTNDIQTIRQARIEAFNAEIASDENFARIRSEHPELKDQTREQLMETNKANVERYISVQVQILGGVLALTFVSVMYSLLAVFFWRSMVKRI